MNQLSLSLVALCLFLCGANFAAALPHLIEARGLASGTINTSMGCTRFYTVKPGNTCNFVANRYGATFEDFRSWNTAVDATCSNLFIGQAYCVAGPKQASVETKTTSVTLSPSTVITSQTSREAAPTTTTSAPAALTTQSITISEVMTSQPSKSQCTKTYTVQGGQTCNAVCSANGITFAQLRSLNPEIDATCTNLWAGKAYCVQTSGSGTPAATSTSIQTTAAPPAPTSDSWSDFLWVSLDNLGIRGFRGKNSGIGSWFRTRNPADDTNGRSWCQLSYKDDWMGFAPDVSVMLNNYGWDLPKAATAYCGLEVLATNPDNGKQALLYIVDGFDSKWVRRPGSVDLTLAAFKSLYGSSTNDKNVVMKNLQWEFTGRRADRYRYNWDGVGYGTK